MARHEWLRPAFFVFAGSQAIETKPQFKKGSKKAPKKGPQKRLG